MANVCNLLLASDPEHVVDFLGDIEIAHCLKVVVPSVVVGDRALVALAVLVAASIAKPDIVSSAGQLEGWRELALVHYPAVGRVQDAVLHVGNRLSIGSLAFQAWDAEDHEDVAVFSGH